MSYMFLKEQISYVKKHGVMLPNGQVFLEKPLFVFKKVRTYNNSLDSSIKNSLVTKNTYLNYDSFGPNLSGAAILAHSINTVGKSTRVDGIANLILPAGTLVNLPVSSQLPKMRASQAIVHSIVRKHDQKEVALAFSGYGGSSTNRMTYLSPKFLVPNRVLSLIQTGAYETLHRPGWMQTFVVNPQFAFDTSLDECRSGIHFFLEAEEALNYH